MYRINLVTGGEITGLGDLMPPFRSQVQTYAGRHPKFADWKSNPRTFFMLIQECLSNFILSTEGECPAEVLQAPQTANTVMTMGDNQGVHYVGMKESCQSGGG